MLRSPAVAPPGEDPVPIAVTSTRLQVARETAVATDTALGGLQALADAHLRACEEAAETASLAGEGGLDAYPVDANLIGLKVALLERWLESRAMPTNDSCRVVAGDGPRLVPGEGMDPSLAAALVVDAYDSGADRLTVVLEGPPSLLAALRVLALVDVEIEVAAVGPFTWPRVPLALATWLFDSLTVAGGDPAAAAPGKTWPGMREARFLAEVGEPVSYSPHARAENLGRLEAWCGRHGVGLAA